MMTQRKLQDIMFSIFDAEALIYYESDTACKTLRLSTGELYILTRGLFLDPTGNDLVRELYAINNSRMLWFGKINIVHG